MERFNKNKTFLWESRHQGGHYRSRGSRGKADGAIGGEKTFAPLIKNNSGAANRAK